MFYQKVRSGQTSGILGPRTVQLKASQTAHLSFMVWSWAQHTGPNFKTHGIVHVEYSKTQNILFCSGANYLFGSSPDSYAILYTSSPVPNYSPNQWYLVKNIVWDVENRSSESTSSTFDLLLPTNHHASLIYLSLNISDLHSMPRIFPRAFLNGKVCIWIYTIPSGSMSK